MDEAAQHTRRRLVASEIRPKPILDDITVLIPTLGRSILEESLYWIVSGGVWPGGLIVVDQGQCPEVEGLIGQLRQLGIDATYIPSDRKGRAAGINDGLVRVETPFVAITDDDCFVAAGWLQNITTFLRRNPMAIVTGRVEAASDDVAIVVLSEEASVQRRPRLKFDTLSGGNMGTSLAVITEVGLFDEDSYLRTAEDGEWSYRALRRGVPIFYRPQIVVRHFGWRESDGQAERYKSYAYSHGGFYGKYLGQGDWFILLRALGHYFRALRRWLRGLMRADQKQTMIGRAYLTGLLPGMIAGFRKRRSGD